MCKCLPDLCDNIKRSCRLSSRCQAVIVPREKEQRLLSLPSAAACEGCRGTTGEALGRECTIQVNHQGHQCNESRSVLRRKKREGAGGEERRGKEREKERSRAKWGKSKEGGEGEW